MSFRNEAYSDLVNDVLFDAFYTKRSNRGMIASIRQFAEVIIRKILDLPESEKVTLGDGKVLKNLRQASGNNQILMDSINNIRTIGNKCTHTQEIEPITNQDVLECKDNLLNLYASLFVMYFKKYEFGTNSEVIRAFSILPPIIRYKCLNELYQHNKSNLSVIDKLSLVLLKASDKERAVRWVEERKEELSNLLPYTEEVIEEHRKERCNKFAQILIENAPASMYVLCMDRILKVDEIIRKNGLLYNNFEQAKDLYLKTGILKGDSDEVVDFNSLMTFVYLGRINKGNPKVANIDSYTIIN
ncbi:MAG: hypothetical protein ABF429_07855 [Zymomonas mobilis]|uniref:hypothetical protein n=1 Tax=Zymomonas mobilis TaxID=542 RepID=UPI0001B707E7|nr:hypothetical protein [Zymomonas mobilis]ACV76203.1 conserved hypothetical protein [Zymomonas mobilis subsp. mobilis NCIMB 11163]